MPADISDIIWFWMNLNLGYLLLWLWYVSRFVNLILDAYSMNHWNGIVSKKEKSFCNDRVNQYLSTAMWKLQFQLIISELTSPTSKIYRTYSFSNVKPTSDHFSVPLATFINKCFSFLFWRKKLKTSIHFIVFSFFWNVKAHNVYGYIICVIAISWHTNNFLKFLARTKHKLKEKWNTFHLNGCWILSYNVAYPQQCRNIKENIYG